MLISMASVEFCLPEARGLAWPGVGSAGTRWPAQVVGLMHFLATKVSLSKSCSAELSEQLNLTAEGHIIKLTPNSFRKNTLVIEFNLLMGKYLKMGSSPVLVAFSLFK